VEGNRFGYIEPNSSTTTAVMTTIMAVNAQPSRRRVHVNATAVTRAITAIPSGSHVHVLPCVSCVHSPNPPAHTTTGNDKPRAKRNASSRTGPAVFSATNTAP
jgi:hypothetical protein